MNSAQFSLFWDPAIFDYGTAKIGPVVPPATSLQLDTSMTAAGKLGVVLNTSSEYLNTINYQVLSLSLRTRLDAPFGSHAIGFGDRPIVTRFRSPTQAFDFGYLWIPGFVQVGTTSPPTVGVGGRILTASNYAVQNTRVTLTNERGDVFVALTNFQGRFSFPNMFHGVSQMRFESKRYRIPNRTITVPNGTGNMAIEAFE